MKPSRLLKTLMFVFSSLFFPLFLNAQHKTLKAQNGNSLTEIVDANSMKQGNWVFYDNKGNIIRKEVYKDHELQSRIVYVDGKEINSINYLIEEGVKSFISMNPSFNGVSFSGEVIINENSSIISIHFYNILDSKLENLLKNEIMTIIENNYQGRNNLILIF